MLLIDSNNAIDRHRRKDTRLVALFDSLEIATCGPVRSEVLTGSRSPRERSLLIAFLDALPTLPIETIVWDFIGDIRAQIHATGFSISLADAAIGCVAIIYDIPLWSRDKAHVAMASIIPALRLFQEPP